MSTGLNPNDLVNVTIQLQPTAVPTASFGGLMVVGNSQHVIDTTQRYRKYTSLASIAADFGTSAPEYLAASAFFSQSPQPSTCFVGFWAAQATNGLLRCAPLSTTAQAISNFTSITSGSCQFTIDGSVVVLSGMNFSAVTNLNGVASIISTALSTHGSCAWNSVYNQFTVTSATTGTSSTVSFGTSTGSGTDISALIGSQVSQGGYAVAGIATETIESAVSTLISASNAWYGLVLAPLGVSIANSDMVQVASIVEAASPRRFFVITSSDSNCYNSASTTDVAYLIQAGGYTHTAVQYSTAGNGNLNPYAGASLFGRQASVNFTAQNSTITLMYKNEPSIVAETLTETQASALAAKNCNVFINYSSPTTSPIAIVQFGTVGSGQYIDTIVGTDWLQNGLQTALFNALYVTATKIPQTDAGVGVLINAAESIMASSVYNGLMAPGTWTGPNFGITSNGAPLLATGATLTKGYLIYAAPVATQSAAARAARQSPTIQIAAKLGGAIHTASVVVSVVN
jgi:hypothetical protein